MTSAWWAWCKIWNARNNRNDEEKILLCLDLTREKISTQSDLSQIPKVKSLERTDFLSGSLGRHGR